MSKNKIPFPLRVVRWVFPKLERLAPALAHRYFVRLFFTPLRYKRPAKEDEFVNTADKTTLKVGANSIQLYSWGNKSNPAVLVIHGWAGRATQFRKFIPALQQAGYRVVGFDGPAHGLSEGKRTNILEFEQVLREVLAKEGTPVAVMAHSFGGVALLYSIANGLPITRVINIASPTIGDDVINTYLKAIGASASTGQAFKSWMMKNYNKTFDEFSGLHLIQQIKTPLELLLVQDEDDNEVALAHALALRKVYPAAKLLQTSGLGHNRILKEDSVVARCVEFIKTGR